MIEIHTPHLFAEGLYRSRAPSTPAELADWVRQFKLKTVLNLCASKINWHEYCAYVAKVDQIMVSCLPLLPPHGTLRLDVRHMLWDASLQPLLLHCEQGVDRTGFCVADHRLYTQNYPRKLAIHEMRAAGSHWRFRWWERFL